MKSRKSTKLEHAQILREMQSFDKPVTEDDRQVGIFWFDTESLELFGVLKMPVSKLMRKQSTYPKYHYQYWRDQQYKKNKDPRMTGKYEDIPRGRVAISPNDSMVVYVGSWYLPYKSVLEREIKKEFNLTEFTFLEDPHWDLGHGPSGDFLASMMGR